MLEAFDRPKLSCSRPFIPSRTHGRDARVAFEMPPNICMKRTTRQVLALTLVATALCVDRAADAAPALRPQSVGIVRQITNRLTVGFRNVVPVVRLHQTRREGVVAQTARKLPVDATAARIEPVQFSPFQFRLPPPVA